MEGGMCGEGVCMAGGHVWQGSCMTVGHVWQGGMHAGGVHGGGHAWQGVLMAGGHAWGACVARGACMAGGACMPHIPPPRTPRDTVGQCAGGTHPTGMHSCIMFYLPNFVKAAH